jgi:RNA recognition motif-containing protein
VGTKLYVGNLSYQVSADKLREIFSAHGEVSDVAIPADRETGRSRGFGFVTMASEEQARTAMQAVNGTELDGRALTVSEARERQEGGGGGRGGGRDRF